MSVVTPVRSRFFFAIGSSFVMVAGMLFGANVAAADSLQVQSYQRASQTATCDSPPESMADWRASWANPYDPISGPTWHPSWERWANNGSGGWTCTRSITWARTPVAPTNASSNDPVSPVTCTEPVGGADVACAVGKIGPGGGLVFLISGGKTYEMAPKNWDDPMNVSAVDPTSVWCNNTSSLLSGTFGIVVGTGAANTALMAPSACTSGAANEATAYSGGDYTDWFLPSKDELNAMYDYKSSIVDAAKYGFVDDFYWTSSQFSNTRALRQYFPTGSQGQGNKTGAIRVRPIRAF